MQVRRKKELLIVKLEPGDEWPGDPARAISGAGLRGGFYTGIGAVDRLTVAFFDLSQSRYLPVALEEPLEIVSLTGNCACDEEGGVILHAHTLATRRDGSAIGGHLVTARVSVTLEIGILDAGCELARRIDPRFGLKLWQL